MVASFLKPMDGLCAALYTQLHLCLAPTVSGFLLLQATLPPSVALLSLPFLRLFRDTEDSEMERAATVRTFEAAAVLTAALALYLLALSAIESVAAAHARVDDTGVMFGLMCVLVAAFGALPAAHAAWRAKEGPAASGADAESGERTPLGGDASPGGGGGGGYGATAAGAGAGGAAARELGHMPPRGTTSAEASAVDDLSCPALICCAPVRPSSAHHHGGGHHHGGHIGTSGDASNGAGQGYGSSDDEGAQLAAHANEADAGADGGGGDGEEEVFGAAKYYAGGSATVRDALGTADYWLTVGIMFLNNAVAYSLLK